MASLGQRIDYDGADDEVGGMVRALNAMLARLEASFTEQRHFIADASHELRTPVAIVRGHLELLAAGTLSAEDRTHAFEVVFAEIDRMNRLVNDLLALARLDTGQMREMQPVELTTLAAEAAAKGRGLSGCGIESRGDRLVWVHGDPDGLMQAVLNLVKNAAAVTPEDGRITVTARLETGRAVIEVADTGPGIKPADLPRIFDRFYRAPGTKRSDGGGSGLGLAITKRLVELHGGTLSARNRDEGGAVFRIDLPATGTPRAFTDAA
jgi:signal transduction histidine kinase